MLVTVAGILPHLSSFARSRRSIIIGSTAVLCSPAGYSSIGVVGLTRLEETVDLAISAFSSSSDPQPSPMALMDYSKRCTVLQYRTRNSYRDGRRIVAGQPPTVILVGPCFAPKPTRNP